MEPEGLKPLRSSTIPWCSFACGKNRIFGTLTFYRFTVRLQFSRVSESEISRSIALRSMAPRGSARGSDNIIIALRGVRVMRPHYNLLLGYSKSTLYQFTQRKNKIMYLQFWTQHPRPATVFKLANRHYEEFMEKIGRPPVIGQEKPENVQKGRDYP